MKDQTFGNERKLVIGNRVFLPGSRTYLMGILNVTPDSFSDGGSYVTSGDAVRGAQEMMEEGADLIDIGGESTRPGHKTVSVEEEIGRVIPVIKAIRRLADFPISIDTSKSQVAAAALDAGADMINDVWGLKRDPEMARVAAGWGVPCCIMHNRTEAVYGSDIMEEILADLRESVEIALQAGMKPANIILDPGIGFGKNFDHNVEVMSRLEVLSGLGFPWLLGTSRKSMIGRILDVPPDERAEGTAATTVIGIMKGCDFIRVHDIKINKAAALVSDAIVRR